MLRSQPRIVPSLTPSSRATRRRASPASTRAIASARTLSGSLLELSSIVLVVVGARARGGRARERGVAVLSSEDPPWDNHPAVRARLILLEREPRSRKWKRAGRTLTFDDDAMQSGEEKAEANGKWWLRQGPGGSRDYTILRRRTRPAFDRSARGGRPEPNGDRSTLGALE
jgi:hypothetical protein